MEIKNKTRLSTLTLLLVLFIGLFIGTRISKDGIDLSNFSSSYSSENKVSDIINFIKRDYVDTIDEEKLGEVAINAILDQLDPHSRYLSPAHYGAMTDQFNGNFYGIGVQFRMVRDTIVIVKVIKNGPAEKIGLLAGDRIIKVDGKLSTGKSITNVDVTKKIKGKKGSKVKIDVFRPFSSKIIGFAIVRDAIQTFSIDGAYMLTPTIGFIKLNSFTATSYDEFKLAVTKLKKQGMKSLVLDLRDNGGGLLSTCISIVDEFLANDELIVYTQGRNRKADFYKSTKGGLLIDTKIAILINENSASASEILAGALQDNDRATIIGRRSFGKGLVQEELELDDGSAILLTVSRYYTPLGRSIQKTYKEGNDAYGTDLLNRYNSGELMHQDSIHPLDTLKYITNKGQILYGGGGITPTIFIPIDTVKAFSAYNSQLNAMFLYEFAFQYCDKNRGTLSKYENFKEFDTNFKLNESVLIELMNYVNKGHQKVNFALLKKEKEFILNEIKARIAQNLFDENEYLIISNRTDFEVQKAKVFLEK